MKRPFNDKIKVHTAPSGTQYVEPIDVFFTPQETKRYVTEARANANRPGKEPR